MISPAPTRCLAIASGRYVEHGTGRYDRDGDLAAFGGDRLSGLDRDRRHPHRLLLAPRSACCIDAGHCPRPRRARQHRRARRRPANRSTGGGPPSGGSRRADACGPPSTHRVDDSGEVGADCIGGATGSVGAGTRLGGVDGFAAGVVEVVPESLDLDAPFDDDESDDESDEDEAPDDDSVEDVRRRRLRLPAATVGLVEPAALERDADRSENLLDLQRSCRSRDARPR